MVINFRQHLHCVINFTSVIENKLQIKHSNSVFVVQVASLVLSGEGVTKVGIPHY